MKSVLIIESYTNNATGRASETLVAGCVNLDEVCAAKNSEWQGGQATELTMKNGGRIKVKGSLSEHFPEWSYPG